LDETVKACEHKRALKLHIAPLEREDGKGWVIGVEGNPFKLRDEEPSKGPVFEPYYDMKKGIMTQLRAFDVETMGILAEQFRDMREQGLEE
jgi:hypothetical protein